MKNLWLYLLVCAAIANAQIVNIPDSNFKAKLLAASPTSSTAYSGGIKVKIDTNNDSQIQVAEAQAIDSLSVPNVIGDPALSISNLSGIEGFSNLKKLDCSQNTMTSLNTAALSGLQVLNCSRTAITSLDVTGIPNLRKLECYMAPITSLNLTGLTNLELLQCAYNQFTTLDVSSLTNLKTLFCYSNALTTLNVTANTQLKKLVCFDNQLTSLQVAGLSQLEELDCNGNSLAGLSLTGLSTLMDLRVYSNQLTSLDLSGLTALKWIMCHNNQITALDFTGLTLLEELVCANNQLSSLDLSGCPLFDSIFCSNNNLTYVNIKNGHNMTNPDSSFGPNPLTFICIDDGESDIVHNIVQFSNLTSVNFNSYCSFITGGPYNTITGTLLFDADNNGCNASDFSNPYLKVNINDGTTTSATFTNASGQYSFETQAGNFTLTPSIENAAFFNFTPPSASVNYPIVDNSLTTQNFCMTANGNHPDLEIAFIGNHIRPGFITPQYLVYHNKGNQSMSGTVSYNFDDGVLDVISTSPAAASQVTNTLTWNFSNLQPFETRYISLHVKANSETQTPPLHVGDPLNFTTAITPVVGDETPTDNTFSTTLVAMNAQDPNDKTCLEGNVVAPENIGKYLHYNINFENVGSANAVNIVVKDTIDTTKFDIASLQLQYASHPVKTKITGNVVEFIFENINLPPANINPIGGHGNVLFKIKTLPTLPVNTQVSNLANIFFDYNAPIDTNVARTTFAALSNPAFTKDQSITVCPNPAKNIISIKAKSEIRSIELYDIQGRILQSVSGHKKETTLDLSEHQDGVYFLKITTKNSISIEKIIKE